METVTAAFHISDPYRDRDPFFTAVVKPFLDENILLNEILDPKTTLRQIVTSWRCQKFRLSVSTLPNQSASTTESGEVAQDNFEPPVTQYHHGL